MTKTPMRAPHAPTLRLPFASLLLTLASCVDAPAPAPATDAGAVVDTPAIDESALDAPESPLDAPAHGIDAPVIDTPAIDTPVVDVSRQPDPRRAAAWAYAVAVGDPEARQASALR